MTNYALVQERFERIDGEVLKQALLEHGKFARADAARIARKVRGILAERLTLEQAEAIRQHLLRHDFAVRCVPAEQLPTPQRPKTIAWLQMDEDGFHYPTGYSEQMMRASWSGVFVVNAGRVAQANETQREVRVGSQLDGEARTVMETQRSSRTAYVTDIIAANDSGVNVHLRFPAIGANYQRTLGLDYAQESWFESYLIVIQRLVAASSFAVVSPETRMLMAQRTAQIETAAGDQTARDEAKRFAEYNRWLLLLAMFRAAEEISDE